MTQRIVIVGNGPAAISAIEAIRETDRMSAITVLSQEAGGAYTPCFLSRYVAGTIGEDKLAIRPADFYERNGVELRGGVSVEAVVPEDDSVVLAGGQRVGYDKLLLACGAHPVMPSEPDLSGPGIAVFRTLADAAGIRERLPHVHNAIVLGSGFVAMEIAEALVEAGTSTSVIVRTSRILRRIFDAEVGGIIEAHMSEHGVHFLKECELVGLERDEAGALTGAVLSGGERVPCDLLVAAVGMRSNIAPVRGTSIAVDRGVLTDAAMRTSVPNVWAAGDVAEIEIGGVRKANLIHPNAVVTGRNAGYGMAGVEKPMRSHLSDMNVLSVFGRSFLSTGSQEGARTLSSRGDDGTLVKVFADEDGVIAGAQLVGDVSRGGLYGSLIQRRIRVDDVPDLLSSHLDYAQTAQLA